MTSLCCLFAESESVKYFMYEKKDFNFLDLMCILIDVNKTGVPRGFRGGSVPPRRSLANDSAVNIDRR